MFILIKSFPEEKPSPAGSCWKADFSSVLKWVISTCATFTSQTPLCLLCSICAIRRRPFKKNHKSAAEDLGKLSGVREGWGRRRANLKFFFVVWSSEQWEANSIFPSHWIWKVPYFRLVQSYGWKILGLYLRLDHSYGMNILEGPLYKAGSWLCMQHSGRSLVSECFIVTSGKFWKVPYFRLVHKYGWKVLEGLLIQAGLVMDGACWNVLHYSAGWNAGSWPFIKLGWHPSPSTEKDILLRLVAFPTSP